MFENEDDWQRQFHLFNITARKLNAWMCWLTQRECKLDTKGKAWALLHKGAKAGARTIRTCQKINRAIQSKQTKVFEGMLKAEFTQQFLKH